MLALISKRLLGSIPLVLVVTFLTFLFQAMAPGDVARSILGDSYTQDAYLELREQLGLNRPLIVQYGDWLWGAVRGDLGISPISGLTVSSEIANRIGVTLSLTLGTVGLSIVIGVALGVVSATRGGWFGRALDVLSLLGFALPNFWLGLVLIAVFAVGLDWFPATGYVPPTTSPSMWLWFLTLPVITLTTSAVAVIATQTRDAMLTTLSRNYILALRANGLSRTSVIFRHALRNAAVPVVTVLGLMFVGLASGAVLIETVFAMPGLGSLAVQATAARDLPLIQGVALAFTLIVVVVNLTVDLAYGWLNPKVRVS